MEHIRQTIVLDGEWWGKGQIFLHLQGQQGWWTLEKVKTQIPWIQGFRFVGFQISDWCSFLLDQSLISCVPIQMFLKLDCWRLGLHRAIQPPHPKDGTDICRRICRLLRYYTSKTANGFLELSKKGWWVFRSMFFLLQNFRGIGRLARVLSFHWLTPPTK